MSPELRGVIDQSFGQIQSGVAQDNESLKSRIAASYLEVAQAYQSNDVMNADKLAEEARRISILFGKRLTILEPRIAELHGELLDLLREYEVIPREDTQKLEGQDDNYGRFAIVKVLEHNFSLPLTQAQIVKNLGDASRFTGPENWEQAQVKDLAQNKRDLTLLRPFSNFMQEYTLSSLVGTPAPELITTREVGPKKFKTLVQRLDQFGIRVKPDISEEPANLSS